LGFVAGRIDRQGGSPATSDLQDNTRLQGTAVANHASALKAHRQNVVHRERNRRYRAQLRSTLKSMRAGITGNDATKVQTALGETVSLIDRMVSKGVIHKNAGSRYKSRLAKRVATKPAAAA
jgi:small subunit ribosomal protein S20